MIDTIFNLGVLALDVYNAFSNDEDESALASVLDVGGALALGAGTLIYDLLSDEERQNGDDNDDEIVELLLGRLNIAKVCVSLWAHCCFADGELTEEEDEMTDSMIAALFSDDSLFPEEITNQEFVLNELIETFNNPLPMKVVVDLASDNPELAANFYEEACIIFAADGYVGVEEREFLNDLADEFGISRMDKKGIERKYLKLSLA
ncbi:MAG: hypothetical protein WBA41_14335 [Rivularia sp. (in: cyanobacteria)]